MSATQKWIIGAVACAFASFISFAQINSYWADNHHFNGLLGWIGIGILTALGACFFGYKIYKNAGGNTGYK